MFNSIIDGSKTYDWGNSAIAAVISIILVFVVLLIIIGITYLIFKLIGVFEMKRKVEAANKALNVTPKDVNSGLLNENDEDMVAAALVATIDYRKEIKKDVKLVSIKEIK